MQTSALAALVFLAGLCLSAWFAARTWNRKIIGRCLPIAYCLAFGFGYSTLGLGSSLIDGLLHSLMTSAVGLAIVGGLWVELRSRSPR